MFRVLGDTRLVTLAWEQLESFRPLHLGQNQVIACGDFGRSERSDPRRAPAAGKPLPRLPPSDAAPAAPPGTLRRGHADRALGSDRLRAASAPGASASLRPSVVHVLPHERRGTPALLSSLGTSPPFCSLTS